MGLRDVPKGPLREGFTTGTCATAAAKAALTAIITGKKQQQVNVQLPIDRVISIPLKNCQFQKNRARCSVIKDAGDDPDVTHGAEISCEVLLTEGREITFKRGTGVGIVTLPGLELKIGEPAINPIPRKMITNALQKLMHDNDLTCGLTVTVSVVDGKAISRKTLNTRVGILEGISILGTTGIVKPYSSSSYIASIEQGIDVAVANGLDELILNSGARSEKYIKKYFKTSPEQAFIHYGNWIGETLVKINSSPIKKISIGIMLGKAVKLGEGKTDTHSCVASWSKRFVKQLALNVGYTPEHAGQILDLNMAGRLTELFDFKQEEPFYQELLRHCFEQCHNQLKNAVLEIYLVGKNGQIIQYHKK